MRKRQGPLFILLTLILTFIFWSVSEPLRNVTPVRQYSEMAASLMLVCFAWVNFISTRHPLLDSLFHGLDKSYLYHKVLSIISVLLIFVHRFTLDAGKGNHYGENRANLGPGPHGLNGPPPGAENGAEFFSGIANLSMLLFIVLILLALFVWKMNYEKWKNIHKLFFIPYMIGIIHYYGSSDYAVTGLSALGLWLNLVNLVGLTSAIYSIGFYERTAFQSRYVVTNIRTVAKDTLEITGKAFKKGIRYKEGQFTFIKFTEEGKQFPSHPFTISQSFRKNEIQFAIKALGDHTSALLKNVQEGDTFAVTSPHGRFDYKAGSNRQVWLAGGIGITPFRSFYQSAIPPQYSIDLFYCYNNEAEGPYLDEIKTLAAGSGIHVHLHDLQTKGFLDAEAICEVVPKTETVDVYFCGPEPMRIKLERELKTCGLRIGHFHYESFQFK